MASLIPGYEYDIFISYRQKDNKYDGWVSEFVDNLKRELESTFKEEISVYFDTNPHDGLLETHDVDASLKEKLKCLIFIPVLSRTYCDIKSFAWEHEFRSFVESASNDRFGLRVKLPNGNIASRVLPVSIHSLDQEDIRLCESLLGFGLSGVEFIYSSAGVNRPLRSKEEKPFENLNGNIYRDQINKVSLAIKELVVGLKKGAGDVLKKEGKERDHSWEVSGEDKRPIPESKFKSVRVRILPGILIALILLVAVIMAFPKLIKLDLNKGVITPGERINIAVMPFQDMTNDTGLFYSQGILEQIIYSLSSYPEDFRVIQSETIRSLFSSSENLNYASVSPSMTSVISKKLESDMYITGTIIKSDSIIRINARLLNTNSEEVLKPFQVEGTRIFPIIDSLSVQVKDYLLISVLKKKLTVENRRFVLTDSPEAFQAYVYGLEAFRNDNLSKAIDYYLEAIRLDTNFTVAYSDLCHMYLNSGRVSLAKEWCLKLRMKRDLANEPMKLWIDFVYAQCFGTPNERLNILRQIQQIAYPPEDYCFMIGLTYFNLKEYDKAIVEFKRSLEATKKLNSKPWFLQEYYFLVEAYYKTGQIKKAEKVLKEAEKYFPDDEDLYWLKAIVALKGGDNEEGNRNIERYISYIKERPASDAEIAYELSVLYTQAGMLDKAEDEIRKCYSLMGDENLPVARFLAEFLIENDRNIAEGLQQIEKVLKVNPNSFIGLDIKGWGLYKQGKYAEALQLLQKGWDLRLQKGVYDHKAFLHLEAAKKAVKSAI